MHGSISTNSVGHDGDRECQRFTPTFLGRKVWLPKLIYGAIPYFYLIVGSLALAATLYIHHWIWIVPHYVLFSAACLHMGIFVHRRRQRARRGRR
jgi:hypothetical protein